ncbi:MAG: DUF3780 domain-containing protein [Roseibium sp.]|uniref:DUF3780 domain-containing protein n=1 Tax=Roseibium sp. TaxID=1936156 RepID=UPI003296F4A0
MAQEKTIGFGVKDKAWQGCFLLRVPKGRNDPIDLIEDFGISAGEDEPQGVARCSVDRHVWRSVADGVRTYLNRRLKAKKMKVGRFMVGENKIERLLGREVSVLLYALENCTVDEAPSVFQGWSDYRPEELWWLFNQIDKSGGYINDPQVGWRRSIKTILGERIAPETSRSRKRVNIQDIPKSFLHDTQGK